MNILISLSLANTFLSVKPDAEGVSMIEEFVKERKLKDPVPSDKLHVTLITSDSKVPVTFDPKRLFEATVTGATVLKESVVITLDCPALFRMHNAVKEVFGIEHTFPEYNIHMTISIGDSEKEQNRIIDHIKTDLIGKHILLTKGD